MAEFEIAIEDYLEELRVARRYSPHTISNYARDLKAVARSATARKLADWQRITSSDVRAIVAEQHRA